MAEETETISQADHPGDYRITNGPVVRFARSDPKLPNDLPEVELPRVYGEPLLFAIARDPKTLFIYWNIDWSSVFESSAPVDRQVHLRVYRGDGTEELSQAVEPMVGNCYLNVSAPREKYRIEIGYYRPAAVWNSVAKSDEVTMPPDRIAENVNVDVATIPFHLSFQRLIDTFRSSNGGNLTQVVSDLQKRAATEAERASLTSEELEILRAMDLSIDQISDARQKFFSADVATIRKRAERLLGFGGSSPSRPFCESSWS